MLAKHFLREGNEMNERFDDIMGFAGVYEYGIISPHDVEFSPDVRKYCEECNGYGKSWACPPAVGTVDECRERAQSYDKMLIFSGKYDVEDSADFEGFMRGMKDFKTIANNVDEGLRSVISDYIVLGNEGCGVCESCTYPNAPCRFPDKLHGSIEGYGVWVSKVASQAGVRYNNGSNTITYFGAVLYNETEGERL
jgi:predicted metal-binding protein